MEGAGEGENGKRGTIRGSVRIIGAGDGCESGDGFGGELHFREGGFWTIYYFRVPLTFYFIGLMRYYFLHPQ